MQNAVLSCNMLKCLQKAHYLLIMVCIKFIRSLTEDLWHSVGVHAPLWQAKAGSISFYEKGELQVAFLIQDVQICNVGVMH